MSLKATSGFVIILLSVKVMEGGNGLSATYSPSEVCGPKGSTVSLYCSYDYTEKQDGRATRVQETFWVVGDRSVDLKREVQYSGRVEYDCYDRRCTLEISDLRESDSAVYRFRFTTNQPNGEYTASSGVTLSVTDPDLEVNVTWSYGWPTLKCQNSCPLSGRYSYVWYRNGKIIQGETSSTYLTYNSYYYSHLDSYSCAVEGHQQFASPPVCAGTESCNRVTYDDRNICATRGSSVNISCSYSSIWSVHSKYWFSHGQQWWTTPPYYNTRARVKAVETRPGRSTLRIADVRESDSAEYRFKFHAGSFEWRSVLPGTTLTVTALQIEVIRVTTHRQHVEAELKCGSSCSPAARPSYVWFKNNGRLQRGRTSLYKASIKPGDEVSCSLGRYENHRSPPVYAPKPPSVSATPSSEIEEGSAVTLTCSSDAKPEANYTWYKNEERRISYLPNESKRLVFTSIQRSASGLYYCRAENQLGSTRSSYTLINVTYAPKAVSLSASPSGEVMEGSRVTLNCSSDANPAATCTWYKDNQTVLQGPESIYVFSHIRSEDGGNYRCRCTNQHGELNSTAVLIHVQRLQTAAIVGSVAAIVLALVFISVFFFIRRKMSLKHTAEPPVTNTQLKMGSVCDDQQEDLDYAKVSFINTQEDPLYLNIRPAQRYPHGENQEEEHTCVEYSVITVRSSHSSPQSGREEADEDLSALYSTVRK